MSLARCRGIMKEFLGVSDNEKALSSNEVIKFVLNDLRDEKLERHIEEMSILEKANHIVYEALGYDASSENIEI